jgi:hypothetical protein
MNAVTHAQNENPQTGPPEQEIATEISVEAKRQLVSRIAASPHLIKAPRLTELLHYITERSLGDANSGLHEQEIGTVVFGRATNYDTSQDNIVRVQIGHLRRKLEKYFSAEGLTEPLLLEIPRGSYVPHFYARIPAVIPAPVLRIIETAEAPVEPALVAPASKSKWLTLGLAAAVLLLAIGCAWLWQQNRQLRQLTRGPLADAPALHRLWSRLLNANQPTDIVLADSMLTLFQDRVGSQLTLQEYLSGSFAAKLPSSLPQKERDQLDTIIQRRYTSIADVLLVNRILRLTDQSGVQPAIHFARDFRVRNLKNHNAILLGGKNSTPWIELFEPQMNFRFTGRESSFRVVNTDPQPGEESVYERQAEGHGYAVVAFLPNLDRTGHVLILQGDDQISTEAAGELVTNEETFAPFSRRLEQKNDRLPWFEVLLRTRKMGNAASAFEIIAIRLPK